jgi:hypothetical protein
MPGDFAIAVPLAVGKPLPLPDPDPTLPPADFIIPTGVTTWDAAAEGVMPGDIIEIEGGVRGALRINNVVGTLGNRITIRSDPTQQVIIRNASARSGWFVFVIDDSQHWHLDGSSTASAFYGFLITTMFAGDAPSAYLQLWGTCRDYEIDHVEVDGKWLPDGSGLGQNGIGIQHNDANIAFGSMWRENIRIHHCFVHDGRGEGIYMGPNYANDAAALRNIEVDHNISWNWGRDGMNLKSMIDGNNSCHHNDIRRTGLRPDEFQAGQQDGIAIFEGYCSMHHNYIEDAGEVGIRMNTFARPDSFGPFPVQDIYNNVVWKTGVSSTAVSQPGDGIRIGVGTGMAQLSANTFNNTIVTTEQHGIWYTGNVLAAECHDNIAVGINLTPYNTQAQITTFNNRSGSIAAENFLNAGAGDFHLTNTSPAKDAGSATGFPADDFDGIARPQGVAADQGAYELEAERNILAEFTFSRGYIASGTPVADADGVFRDFGFILGAEPWDSPITITDIENTNPARVHFTGSLPDPMSSTGTHIDTPGLTLGVITSGMTEMSGRLIRPKNIAAGEFDAYQDGDDVGYNPDSKTQDLAEIQGNTAVDATGYGTWSGSVQAQAYKKYVDRSQGWDVFGADYPNLGMTTQVTPPDTINGAATAVTPLEGSRFLSHQINYWIDHTRQPENDPSGQWQAQNKPRNQIICNNQVTQLPDRDTFWFGFSIHVPDNFDITSNTRTGDLGETQLFSCKNGALGGQGTLAGILITAHANVSVGELAWVMDADLTGDGVGGTTEDIYLGDVNDDLGLWTSFILKMQRDETSGILEVWKSTGAYLGGANPLDRLMTKVYSRVGLPVGQPPNLEPGWGFTICRQYKHAWHHWTGTSTSYEQWLGFDSVRWGSEETHSTGFADVHPFRRAEP